MTARTHVIVMLVAAGGVLAALWIAGVPLGAAAPLALFLACPLMMFFMMRGMDHGGSGQTHDHSDPSARQDHQDHNHHDASGR